MGSDGVDCALDRFGGVFEAFEPVVEVYAALAYGVECLVADAAAEHLLVEVVVAHVAGSAVGVGHDHYFFYSEFVYGYYEGAHG